MAIVTTVRTSAKPDGGWLSDSVCCKCLLFGFIEQVLTPPF